jgi:tungstate transport system permease protein
MLIEGVRLLHHDPYLGALTVRTLRLGFEATAIAVVVGLPAACTIGLGRARLSGWGLVLANAGLGLPPVAVGVYLFLLLPGRNAPWGGMWFHTMSGMVLGQTLLALPVVIAVSAIAIRELPDGLIEQARAFGGGGWRLGVFVLREAKIGVFTAVIFALGSAFAEVGAVTLIGGNSITTTATLASQVITDAQGANGVPGAVEHGLVLMGLMVALGVLLTIGQHWRAGALRRSVRRRRPARTAGTVA